MEALNEHLQQLSTEDLMTLCVESGSQIFKNDSVIRELISKYKLGNNFYIALIALRSALLTEVTRRYYIK